MNDQQMVPDFEPIVINAKKIADWSERLAHLYQDKKYLDMRLKELERKIEAASYLLMTEEALSTFEQSDVESKGDGQS